jgi:5-methyltetrahydropteroyltriglutamate--homocysteine methyltransferase
VLEIMLEIEAHRATLDDPRFDRATSDAVKEVVGQQIDIGVDVISDGEMARMGFARYMNQRLAGFEPREIEPGEVLPSSPPADTVQFPGYFELYNQQFRYWWMDPEVDISELPNVYGNFELWQVTGKVEYIGRDAIKAEIRRLKDALALQGKMPSDVFLTSTPPTVGFGGRRGVLDHYPSDEAFLYAMADAVREEYLEIINAGFLLQIDYPNASRPRQYKDREGKSVQTSAEMGVDALNYALRDIPEEKIRIHYCSTSGLGPHLSNPPLKESIAPVLLKINAQAYGIEGANARHEHEWQVWKDIKLPEGKILIPGVIAHNYQVVEHPELVAWRIENFASVVGKENVIAGIDCGFSQQWDARRTHPEVQWAKFQSLVEGAAIASKKLWGR